MFQSIVWKALKLKTLSAAFLTIADSIWLQLHVGGCAPFIIITINNNKAFLTKVNGLRIDWIMPVTKEDEGSSTPPPPSTKIWAP